MTLPPASEPRPDGSHPTTPPKKGLPGWLIPLVAALAALLLLLLLLSQCGGGDEEDAAAGGATTDPTATATTSPSASPSPSPTVSTSPAPAVTTPSTPSAPALPQAGAGDVLVTAGGVALLPLVADGTDASLSDVVGETVTADGVAVQDVVTDRGFWVGPSADQRVLVLFDVEGESEVTIQTGQTVSFEGTVTEASDGFVEGLDLEEGEGEELLQSQGAYLEVVPTDLEVVDPA